MNILRRSVCRSMFDMNRVARLARPNKKWLVVKASKSSGSSLTLVGGLEFSICSTRHMAVDSTSSVSVLFPTIASIVFLNLLTIRYQSPPKCGALGGLNFLFFCFWAKDCSISDPFCYPFSNLSPAPRKSFPLLLKMVLGFGLRAMNLVVAARHESASNLETFSTCTVLVFKHVNRQHHRFDCFLMTISSNGPK